MKITAAALLLLFAGTARAQTEFHATNELAVTYNDTAGPGRAASSLTRGVNFPGNAQPLRQRHEGRLGI